jgi:hypothetical protein
MEQTNLKQDRQSNLRHIPEGILIEMVYAFLIIGVCLLFSLILGR